MNLLVDQRRADEADEAPHGGTREAQDRLHWRESEGGVSPASRVRSRLPTRTRLRRLLDSGEERGTAFCAHKDSRGVPPDAVMKGCVGPGASASLPSEPRLPRQRGELNSTACPMLGPHRCSSSLWSVWAASGGPLGQFILHRPTWCPASDPAEPVLVCGEARSVGASGLLPGGYAGPTGCLRTISFVCAGAGPCPLPSVTCQQNQESEVRKELLGNR